MKFVVNKGVLIKYVSVSSMKRTPVNEVKKMRASKGLGDTIEKITEATGIKKVVETISKATNKGCGCNERKEALNTMFPYKTE